MLKCQQVLMLPLQKLLLVSLAADSQLKTVTSFFPLKAKREVVFKDSHKWLQVCSRLKKTNKKLTV